MVIPDTLNRALASSSFKELSKAVNIEISVKKLDT